MVNKPISAALAALSTPPVLVTRCTIAAGAIALTLPALTATTAQLSDRDTKVFHFNVFVDSVLRSLAAQARLLDPAERRDLG